MATATASRSSQGKVTVGDTSKKKTKEVTADGFSTKSLMKNAKVGQKSKRSIRIDFFEQVTEPPAAGAFKKRPAKPTAFRKFYERGDFPIALEHDTKGNKIAWKVSLKVI